MYLHNEDIQISIVLEGVNKLDVCFFSDLRVVQLKFFWENGVKSFAIYWFGSKIFILKERISSTILFFYAWFGK